MSKGILRDSEVQRQLTFVLQSASVCCSVLHADLKRHSKRLWSTTIVHISVAECCSMLQCVAGGCQQAFLETLKYNDRAHVCALVAECCNVLHADVKRHSKRLRIAMTVQSFVAACCSVLQCVACGSQKAFQKTLKYNDRPHAFCRVLQSVQCCNVLHADIAHLKMHL